MNAEKKKALIVVLFVSIATIATCTNYLNGADSMIVLLSIVGLGFFAVSPYLSISKAKGIDQGMYGGLFFHGQMTRENDILVFRCCTLKQNIGICRKGSQVPVIRINVFNGIIALGNYTTQLRATVDV